MDKRELYYYKQMKYTAKLRECNMQQDGGSVGMPGLKSSNPIVMWGDDVNDKMKELFGYKEGKFPPDDKFMQPSMVFPTSVNNFVDAVSNKGVWVLRTGKGSTLIELVMTMADSAENKLKGLDSGVDITINTVRTSFRKPIIALLKDNGVSGADELFDKVFNYKTIMDKKKELTNANKPTEFPINQVLKITSFDRFKDAVDNAASVLKENGVNVKYAAYIDFATIGSNKSSAFYTIGQKS
jgi:hypothetical protein